MQVSGCSLELATRSFEKLEAIKSESTAVASFLPISTEKALMQTEAIASLMIAASKSGNAAIKDQVVGTIMLTLRRLYGYFNTPIPTDNAADYLGDLALGFMQDFSELTILDWGLFFDKVKKRSVTISQDLNYNGTDLSGTVQFHNGTVYNNLSPALIAEWLHIYCTWRRSEREYLLWKEKEAASPELSPAQTCLIFLSQAVNKGEDGLRKSTLAFQEDFQKQCTGFIELGGKQAARLLWRHAASQEREDIQTWLEEYMKNNPQIT